MLLNGQHLGHLHLFMFWINVYFKKNRAELLQHDFCNLPNPHLLKRGGLFSLFQKWLVEDSYISTISTPSIRATVIKSLSPRPETVAIIIWSLDIVGASLVI